MQDQPVETREENPLGARFALRSSSAKSQGSQVHFVYDRETRRNALVEVVDAEILTEWSPKELPEYPELEGLIEVREVLREQGGLWLLTEQLAATSLEDYIAEYGPLPLDLAFEVFKEIAQTLDLLNASGKSYGAVTPRTILLVERKNTLTARLSTPWRATAIPHSPALRGGLSPYCSYEQAREVSVEDDVFAFAASLVFSLTGVAPDQGPPLESLPNDLKGMLQQAMAADPRQRFHSFKALSNILGALAQQRLDIPKINLTNPAPGVLLANQYRVIKILGEGGMARVFLAKDELLGTLVAIKLLNESSMSEPEVVERFLNEAAIQAKLVHPEPHPNVVAVHRVLREEPIGFVMEFVEGLAFDEFMLKAPVDEALLSSLFAQAARGLDHAHQNRIVHRDIKPSNILVTEQDGELLAKLMDFGISKQLDQPKTRTNLVLGTLGFIAPELFISAKDATPQSDIYALGCCLFEAVTGDVPFSVSGGLRSLAFRVYNEAPPLPSQLGAKISKELEALILLTLAKRPDDRPMSALWVAERLELIATQSKDPQLAVALELLEKELRKPGKREATASDSAFAQTLRSVRKSIHTDGRAIAPLAGTQKEQRRRQGGVLIFLSLLLVFMVIGIALYYSLKSDSASDVDAATQEAKPDPTPPKDPVASNELQPNDPSPGNEVLPSTVVVGLDDLLSEAREEAQSGDKRRALKLYAEAAEQLESNEKADEDDVAATYQEMASLYEDVATEVQQESEGDNALSEEERLAQRREVRQLLTQASQAYGRAAQTSKDIQLFVKKAAIDRNRGDAEAALETLKQAEEIAQGQDKAELQEQIEEIEAAYASAEPDQPPVRPDGPTPPAVGEEAEDKDRPTVEIWIESDPRGAKAYFKGRRLGRTPLIKKIPKQDDPIKIVLKHSRRYPETVKIDGQFGGHVEVQMKLKVPKID